MTYYIEVERHTKTVKIEGVELRYIERKVDREKGCVVLIHGLGGDACAWSVVQDLLALRGYSSIALDLRGHGGSDDPLWFEDFSIRCLSNDIESLVRYLGVKKVTLVGHCFGGAACMMVAGDRPKWLKNLVLISTTNSLPFSRLSSGAGKFLLKIIKTLSYLFPAGNKSKGRDYERFRRSGDYNVFRVLSDIYSVSWRSYLLSLFNFLFFDGSEVMGKIEVKTLVVCGENDKVFGKEMSKRIGRGIRNSKVVFLKNTNHVVVINEPELLTGELLKFLT